MADVESHRDAKLSAHIKRRSALKIFLFMVAAVLLFIATVIWLVIFVWVHSRYTSKGPSAASRCLNHGCLQKGEPEDKICLGDDCSMTESHDNKKCVGSHCINTEKPEDNKCIGDHCIKNGWKQW